MGRAAQQAGGQRHRNGKPEMNTLKDRIRSTKSQVRIAAKQFNQAERLLARLTKSLEQLEKKSGLENAKQKAKSAERAASIATVKR